MTLGRRFAEFTGLDITDLISTVVESFADKTASGLDESQHAPKKDSQNSQSLGQVSSLIIFPAFLEYESMLESKNCH